MRKSRTLLAAALAGALTLGAAPALATVAYAEPGDQAPAAQENATVEIASAEDLANAIKNQAAGQTWNITNDITVAEPVEGNYEGQTGWALPIQANGITINGNGHKVTSKIDRANGAWATQNFITVWGDDVTINGLTIDCGNVSNGINKAVEVLGSGFTISGCTLLPGTFGNSGSLCFNGANGLTGATVEDVTLSSWISTSTVGEGAVTLDGVTVDFCGNDYAADSDLYFPVRSNVTVGEGGLTVKVDGTLSNLNNVTKNLPDGATLELTEDITVPESVYVSADNVTVNGKGNKIIASESLVGDSDYNVAQNNVFSTAAMPADGHKVDGFVIENVTIVGSSTSKNVLNITDSTNVTIGAGVVLDHSISPKGAPLIVNNSDVTVAGDAELVTGAGSWYAANVDPKSGSASLVVKGDGSLTFSGDASKPPVVATGEATVDLGASGEDLGNGVYGKAAAHIGDQGYLTLDAAVDAAKPGDTITLAEGEHEGNLVLDKALTIVGPEDGEATITWNAEDAQAQKYLGTRDIYPTVFSTADLTLKNVTIAGPGPEGQHVQLDGVYVSGGNLTMDNVTVRDIRCTGDGNEICGVQTGIGVVFEGTGDLTVTNSTIVDFNKQAIDASTTGDVLIDGNTITGAGDQQIIAQNGIVLRGGNATISNNTISGLIYSADNEWAHGSAAVYVFGDTTARLEGNTISDNDWALYVDEDATATGRRNVILDPVYNYTDNEVDLSENYWGEDPDFSVLVPSDGTDNPVKVYPRYADEAMTQLVDEQGNPVVETVTVTFMCGDKVHATVKVEKNSTIPADQVPADPVLEGRVFVGWYLSPYEMTDESLVDLGHAAFGSDVTLYAGFVPAGAVDATPEPGASADAGQAADLPKTGDAAAVAPLVASGVSGVAALVAGAEVLRRRSK